LLLTPSNSGSHILFWSDGFVTLRRREDFTIYFSFEAGIVQWYSAGLRAGVRVPAWAGNFSLHHRVHSGSGAHSAFIRWVPGAPSLGVKWPGPEADHSPPSSAEVKNVWSYTSPLHYVSMVWCSVKNSTATTLLYHTSCDTHFKIR
jgi:hypothetical protein